VRIEPEITDVCIGVHFLSMPVLDEENAVIRFGFLAHIGDKEGAWNVRHLTVVVEGEGL
jgi:hypothetical protein